MKQSQEVKAFKNELRNYDFYQKRLKSLTEQREWCYHQLGGIHSPKLDGLPSEHNSHKSDVQLDREYKLRNEIENWERKITLTQAKIDEIDEILCRIENGSNEGLIEREMTFNMYAKGMTCDKLAIKYGYSRTNVKWKINQAIKKALDN